LSENLTVEDVEIFNLKSLNKKGRQVDMLILKIPLSKWLTSELSKKILKTLPPFAKIEVNPQKLF